MIVNPGSVDVTTYFVLRLAASGVEATGLTITDIDLQYTRSGVAPTAKVDATALAATDSAHGDNQAIEIDPTDQPGLYRVDWPDAAFAAGVREVILTVKCATAFTEHLRVELGPAVNVELWNATAVPSEHTSGYPIVTVKDGTGTGEINTNGGKVVGVELVDVVTLVNTATTVTNQLTAAAIATGIWQDTVAGDFTTALSVGKSVMNGVTLGTGLTVARCTLTDTLTTYTGNTLQTANVATLITTVGTAGAGLTDLGGMSTTMKAQVESEANDALVGQNLDHLLKAAAVAGDAVDESIIARLASKSATPSFASFVNTTDSLEAIRDNQPTVTGGGVTLADGVTHGGTTAKIRLGSSNSTPAWHVTNSNGDAVLFDATAGTGNAFTCHAFSGQGMYLYSESTYGLWTRGWDFGTLIQSDNSNALYIDSGNGAGIFIEAAGHGIDMAITGTNKHGINVTAGNAGVCNAINLVAGTGGVGLRSDSVTITGTTTLTGAVSATNASNDIRGIKLTSDGLALVTAWTVNITGNLSGSVGSVTADVGITQAGADKAWNTASRTLTAFGFTVAATVADKTGYALSAMGLDLVVPADPSGEPVLGTASIVNWIGYFGAWSVNEVRSDSDSVNLRNTANNADIAAHVIADNGTTFTSGAAS